jgi:hypothetical protein
VQVKEISTLKLMYNNVTFSKNHSSWIRASLFDGRTLRGLHNKGFIDFDDEHENITLTELGAGIAVFGEEYFDEVINCL